MENKQSVTVIGGGSWATALVKLLSNNAKEVVWWMRNQEAVDHILAYKHNPNYLTSVEVNLDIVKPTTDLHYAMQTNDLVIIAHPSAFIDTIFRDFPVEGLENKTFFSAIKGIIPEYKAITIK